MTAIVLDTGALMALEHDDRRVWELLREAADTEEIVQVPAGVIAQAWRDGSRQVLLVRALAHCDEVPLDGVDARNSGELCGRARDRDRLRQEILERLGWTMHRVWSTAWFADRGREIRALRSAIDNALQAPSGNGGPRPTRPGPLVATVPNDLDTRREWAHDYVEPTASAPFDRAVRALIKVGKVNGPDPLSLAN